MIAPSSGLNMFSGKLNSHNHSVLEQMFPNLRKKSEKNKNKKSQEESLKQEMEQHTAYLIAKMKKVVQEDHYAIMSQQPAISRLCLIREVDEELRKKMVQHEFLAQGGIKVLSDWISENPDGSYPLVQVIELVYTILENLPIESQHLEQSKIAKVLSLYAKNLCGYPHLANRALTIIQRWQAIVYKLSYKYDEDGYHERKQRDLREKIKQIGSRMDMGNAEEELIKRNPTGQIIMTSSNFDFIEKPKPIVEPRKLKERSCTAKEQIEKAFNQLRKQKNTTGQFI
ncbi:cg9915-pa [Stylonychia lemnae]|uniref:Cg9915-pa n=1 Tax=Stylonychia lemnae TaxID=5949 RepID=A0A078A3G1_STYLE|nr:cg9915-pa [Stylonychia lemnae]|eukprot:CDW75299.1 cg9915-pa [Stylonychia lemnae]